MTGEKVKEVAKMYDKALERSGATVAKSEKFGGRRDEHLRHMCRSIISFIDEGRVEKAMRWLGFMQGAFWTVGRYTIEEMADHNRPAESEGEQRDE